MNLAKLFEMQKELDARILEEHPVQEGEDRLAKKILALLVELGELANEWRGFKYWSKDQKPRTEKQVICSTCNGEAVWYTGHIEDGLPHTEACDYCHGTGYEIVGNPLLEEYVDCMHFILSIGNELGYQYTPRTYMVSDDVTKIFIEINYKASELAYIVSEFEMKSHRYAFDAYQDLFDCFLWLGKKLGFTWAHVEHAYYQKNKENFRRQEEGY